MNKEKRRYWKYMSAALSFLLITSGIVVFSGCANVDGNYRSGHSEGITFEFYAGPVFPLTLMEQQDSVRATRSVNYDFSLYGSENGSGSQVTDAYTLHNASPSDVTVTAMYPYVGSFNMEEFPVVTLNQSPVVYEIFGGEYAGGFTGGGGESESLNLLDNLSWEDYRKMLEDGSYLSDAFSAPQNLDQPAVVYKLYDIVNQNQNAGPASLCMLLDYDSEKSTLFTFGFNGGGRQKGTKIEYRDFFIREWHDRPDWKVKYLIVLGEDINGYTLQGYQDGSCTPGEELDWPDAKVERIETTFGEALKECARIRYDAIVGNENHGGALDRYVNEKVSFEQYYGQIVKHFMKHGPMGSEPKERYDMAIKHLDEFILEAGTINRILYLTFDITIPAGETVSLNIEQLKPASYDHHHNDKEGADLNGYDMVTFLGSNLIFDRQSASISAYDSIEIVRQNFGFDPEAGITAVELDLNEPHYYMEIRKVKP